MDTLFEKPGIHCSILDVKCICGHTFLDIFREFRLLEHCIIPLFPSLFVSPVRAGFDTKWSSSFSRLYYKYFYSVGNLTGGRAILSAAHRTI